jgi:hypothetical protein
VHFEIDIFLLQLGNLASKLVVFKEKGACLVVFVKFLLSSWACIVFHQRGTNENIFQIVKFGIKGLVFKHH